MKCAKCNREIPDKSKFCSYCGESIGDNKKDETKTAGIPLTSIASRYNGPTTPPQKTKKKPIIVSKELVAIIIIVVSIMVLLIFSVIKNHAKSTNPFSENVGTEGENSTNEADTSEAKNDNGDSNNITSGGSEKTTSEEETNVVDNSSDLENDSSSDGQFKKDCMPSEYIPYGINTGNVAADNFAVKQGDWVYFTCDGRIYKQNSKGETYIILEEGTISIHDDNLNICGDYLYFRHEEPDTHVNTIDRIRTDGKERETVISDGNVAFGDFSFVCDYEDQLIICSESHLKDGYSEDHNNYVASYMRYSLDDSSITLEYTPDDYNGIPISSIKIIGMSRGYVYALEYYCNKGGASKVVAKIDPKSFSIERLEFVQSVNVFKVAFNGDSLFLTDDTSHYTLHMVDLDSMTVTYDATYLDGEIPMVCYKTNGYNKLIFNDMWMSNIDTFPDNKGRYIGDVSFKNASIIDDYLYYSIKDEYGWKQIYKTSVYDEVSETVFIQEVTNKIEQ